MRAVSLLRVAAASFGALLLARPAAAAGDEPIALTWSAPNRADCPDSVYVLGEIERYVGVGEPRPGKSIQAKATVRGIGLDRWQLRLRTTDAGVEGERVFEDQSCRAVADAAVVVLAWMIDPDAMANRSLPAPKDSPKPKQAIPPPDSNAKPPPDSSGEASRLGSFAALGLLGDAGTLPLPALGAQLQGGLTWRRLRLAARVGYWPSRSKVIDPPSQPVAAGARFSLATFGLSACLDALPATAARRFQISGCVGPELEVLRGTSFGVSDPAPASKAWLAVSGGVEARWLFSAPLGLVLDARAVLPSEREHFAIQGVGEIYRPAAVAGRVGLGLELKL